MTQISKKDYKVVRSIKSGCTNKEITCNECFIYSCCQNSAKLNLFLLNFDKVFSYISTPSILKLLRKYKKIQKFLL